MGPWAPGAALEWPQQAWGGISMAAPGLGRDWSGRTWVPGHQKFENVSTNTFVVNFRVPNGENKAEIERAGPPWRDSCRNHAPSFLDGAKRLDGDPIGDKKV